MDETDLAFAGIARQAEAIRDGSVSSSELAELCLERIARLDPELNAFRVVFAERARAEAAQADARRNATVVAKTPMTLLTLTGWDVKRLEQKSPEAMRELESVIEQRRSQSG